MDDNFSENILMVCRVLEKHDVQYLIVGGTAVAFHGYYRISVLPNGLPADKHDFDLWYNPSYENYFNLLAALEELGIDTKKYKKEEEPRPQESFFKLDFEGFTLDFLPKILGLVNFNTSFSNKVTCPIKGIEIYVLSKEDLVKSKKATSRSKDKEDLSKLNARSPKDQNE